MGTTTTTMMMVMMIMLCFFSILPIILTITIPAKFMAVTSTLGLALQAMHSQRRAELM